jgi:hypothetical protein
MASLQVGADLGTAHFDIIYIMRTVRRESARRTDSIGLERRNNPVCRARVPNRGRPELPGIKLTTYRTRGSPWAVRDEGHEQRPAPGARPREILGLGLGTACGQKRRETLADPALQLWERKKFLTIHSGPESLQ